MMERQILVHVYHPQNDRKQKNRQSLHYYTAAAELGHNIHCCIKQTRLSPKIGGVCTICYRQHLAHGPIEL
jgi:hypothetical protein